MTTKATMTPLPRNEYPTCEECGYLVVTGQEYRPVLVTSLNAPPDWGIEHVSCSPKEG